MVGQSQKEKNKVSLSLIGPRCRTALQSHPSRWEASRGYFNSGVRFLSEGREERRKILLENLCVHGSGPITSSHLLQETMFPRCDTPSPPQDPAAAAGSRQIPIAMMVSPQAWPMCLSASWPRKMGAGLAHSKMQPRIWGSSCPCGNPVSAKSHSPHPSGGKFREASWVHSWPPLGLCCAHQWKQPPQCTLTCSVSLSLSCFPHSLPASFLPSSSG